MRVDCGKAMNNPFELAKIEDEAADWAVLLADDPDNAEQLQQFTLWLNSSTLHVDVWERTRRAQRGLGQLSATTEAHWPTASPHRSRSASRRIGQSITRTFGRKSTIVGLAVVACMVVVSIPHLMLQLSADYLTGSGERQSYLLQDGSRLHLAPKSAVDIRFSDRQRFVRLLRGSAYFDVHPDAERPFSVDAGGTRATVLGTAFSIDRTESGARVSVAHGQVKVEDQSVTPLLSEHLGAGDQLAVTWGEGASISQVLPESIAGWRNGELAARNLPVSELVQAFRPYYSGFILVGEPFASQRVTGFYQLDDPVATLTDMARAHGVTVQQIGPWALVIGY